YAVEAKDFSSWMLRLGCQVKSLDAETFEVLPPIFRWDIEFEEDLIEEYARLNGYDKIPESFPPLRSEPTSHAASYVQLQQLSLKLREFGYAQCVNLGFINK